MRKSQLPRWLDRFAERLIPPCSREHVMGDMAECSDSKLQFLSNLASVLPGVIWSQVRRRVGWKSFVLGAVVDAFILGAVQAYFNAPFLNEGAWSWARLAAVWATWIAGAVLVAAYRPADKPTPWSFRGCAKAAIVATGMAVALRVPLAGVVVGLAVVIAGWSAVILVLSMPWLKLEKLRQPLSLETLPEHARLFQRGIWWRNARESGIAIALIGFQSLELFRSTDSFESLEKMLLIAGMLFIVCYLHFWANSRSIPKDADAQTVLQFHCGEIVRQRNILRAVPFWYLLPVAPGMIVSVLGNSRGASGLMGLAVIGGVFYFIWRLNLWGAQWLDRQLQEADALQEKLDGI